MLLHRELFSKLEWGIGILMATSLKFPHQHQEKLMYFIVTEPTGKSKAAWKMVTAFLYFSYRPFQGFFRTGTFFRLNVKI